MKKTNLNNNLSEQALNQLLLQIAGKKLIDSLSHSPNQVAMIGDTEHDYEVAEAMGVKCFLMDRGHNSVDRLQSRQDKVFSSFSELLEELA